MSANRRLQPILLCALIASHGCAQSAAVDDDAVDASREAEIDSGGLDASVVLDASRPDPGPDVFAPSNDASRLDPVVREAGPVAPMTDAAVDDASVERDAGGEGPRSEDASSAGAPDTGTPGDDAGTPPVVAADAGIPPTVSCRPGTYRGPFSGSIRRLITLIQRDVKGTVSLTLGAGRVAGTLTIEQGTFTGMEEDGDAVTAKVVGVVSCASKALTGTRLVDGDFADPLAGGSFGGPLSGTFDDAAGTLQGDWTFDGAAPTLAGQGTWSAKR